MKTNLFRIAVVSLIATLAAAAPIRALAQDATKEKPAAAEKKDVPKGAKKTAKNPPFHGKLTAVDKKAMTITVGERTFQITSDSKLSKGGKPATLADAVVGEEVGGNYQKGDDGKLKAGTVRFGAKPEGDAKKSGDAKKGTEKKQP
jgi:hypothetical protein